MKKVLTAALILFSLATLSWAEISKVGEIHAIFLTEKDPEQATIEVGALENQTLSLVDDEHDLELSLDSPHARQLVNGLKEAETMLTLAIIGTAPIPKSMMGVQIAKVGSQTSDGGYIGVEISCLRLDNDHYATLNFHTVGKEKLYLLCKPQDAAKLAASIESVVGPAEPTEEPLQSSSAASSGITWTLPDREYVEFKKDPNYLAASKALNDAWALVKQKTSKARFDKLRAQQSEWIRTGRNEAAKAYFERDKSENDVFDRSSKRDCYRYATLVRAGSLCNMLEPIGMDAGPKMKGRIFTYSQKASYGVKMKDEETDLTIVWLNKNRTLAKVSIDNAVGITNEYGPNIGMFEGYAFTDAKGNLISAAENGALKITFQVKNAVVQAEPGTEEDCGVGVSLNGTYSRRGK